MSSNWVKRRLSLRTGISIAAFSLLFLLVTTFFLFQLSYQDELNKIHNSLFQLAKTVEPSSQVAVYLDNNELADEITVGLLGNDNVAGVILHSQSGMRITQGNTDTQNMRLTVNQLFDPFTPDLPIGALTLIPNQQLIEATAKERASFYIILLGASSASMVALVIFLVNTQLTKPLNHIAHQLHLIKPGSSATLSIPKGHEHDEIGSLVNDSNELLGEIRRTFVQKNKLYEEISELERKFRLLFDNAKVGIALVDMRGELLLNNPAFSALLGQQAMELLESKQTEKAIKQFVESNEIIKAMQTTASSATPISIDVTQLRENAQKRYFHCIFSKVEIEGESDHLEIVLYDITERVLHERRIKLESEVDSLTGLLNRRGGLRSIEQKIQQQPSSYHAALLIDLDKFKPVNDTHGHDAGDLVLKTVSKRLMQSVRSSDIVMRWGGDEFLLFITIDSNKPDDVASGLAAKLISSLSREISLDDLSISENVILGASIGIALYPDHSVNTDELINQADQAMYDVKHQGRNNFKIYTTPNA